MSTALAVRPTALAVVDPPARWNFYAEDTDRSWGWSNHVYSLGHAFVGFGETPGAALAEARGQQREDFTQFVADEDSVGLVAVASAAHVSITLDLGESVPSPHAARQLLAAIESGPVDPTEVEELMGETDCHHGCCVEADGRCAHGHDAAAVTLGIS